MALHTGAAEERDGDYFGQPVNRVARLLSAAHGGQTLLSLTTVELVRDALPQGVTLRDLGGHRLRDLARPERISQLVAPDLPADFPPLRSLEAFAHNLPVQLTSFIGREPQIAEVKRLLSATRLLTLMGVGGGGKTRLALQVAADVMDEYPDGVWLTELAALTDPTLLPQTVASTFGVREEPNRPLHEALAEHLQHKQLMLVLDNCEHLIEACAQLADALLRACPRLRILATSREALGIAGETAFRVPSLSLPDPKQWSVTSDQLSVTSPSSSSLIPHPSSLTQYEAVRLFMDRATAVQPTFTVTSQNAPAMAQICWRLDGIPLAIELAAAWVKALTVEQIAARLDDRFRLLTGGSRTPLPRQQTLRALFDWSYDLLPEAERALFRRLSVFASGWTLEAAEVVCGDEDAGIQGYKDASDDSHSLSLHPCISVSLHPFDVLHLLSRLVDKSLVLAEEQGGTKRYRLLETMRQYARDRLAESGEAEAVRGRHRDCYLALAEEAEAHLIGAEEATWLNRLETEHDNLRAALAWSVEGEARLRLAGALHRFWFVRGYLNEGRGWLEGALARGSPISEAVQAKALNGAGILAWAQGDYAAARRFHEKGLTIRWKLGDQQGIAASLNNLGIVASEQGDYAMAVSYYEQSLTTYREMGNTARVAMVLNNMGTVLKDQGDHAAARPLLEESLSIQRQLGDQGRVATVLHNLGEIACTQGDCATARQHFEESLAIRRELGDRINIPLSLVGLGIVAAHQSDDERAARLFGAAEAAREAVGAPLPPSERADYENSVAAVRDRLGEEAYAAAWAQGKAMTTGAGEQAIEYALGRTPLQARETE